MMDKIDELLDSIDNDVREYDEDLGIPRNDEITWENCRESVKNYSRKLLWKFVQKCNGDTPESDIDDACNEFITESGLDAKE